MVVVVVVVVGVVKYDNMDLPNINSDLPLLVLETFQAIRPEYTPVLLTCACMCCLPILLECMEQLPVMIAWPTYPPTHNCENYAHRKLGTTKQHHLSKRSKARRLPITIHKYTPLAPSPRFINKDILMLE